MKTAVLRSRTAAKFASLLVAAAFWATLSARPAAAAEPLHLLPGSTAAYVEVTDSSALLERLLSPETEELLKGIDAYQKYLKSKQYGEALAVRLLLESNLGTTWQAALKDLTSGGVYLAFDPQSNAAILIARSGKPELLTRLNDTLVELIEADASANSRPSPIKSKEYEGVKGWQFGPGEVHVILDDLLVVSNKSEALKGVIDRYRDDSALSLAETAAFNQAKSHKPAAAVGWFWASLETVRQAPNVQKALDGPSDNPLIELLLGGVLDAMKRASFAVASLQLEGDQLRLRAELPRDPAQTSATRAWYFSPAGESGAAAALVTPETIANFSLFRNLAGLWQAREELFNEKVVAGFTQADTQLGLFFSGRDFGPEVLGELDPRVQFVVARQEYSADQPVPALKLPAFALVLKMKHPEEIATQLLVAYQKIVGIANIVGGQQGQPQLLLGAEDYHGATISKATYFEEAKSDPGQAKVNYNFSPACARVGEHFVIGSTVGVTRQLVDLLASPNAAPATPANTSLSLAGEPLAAILKDNRELLISQNMLSEGRDRGEAESAIDSLLKLVQAAKQAGIKLLAEPESLALEVSLQVRPD